MSLANVLIHLSLGPSNGIVRSFILLLLLVIFVVNFDLKTALGLAQGTYLENKLPW